MAQALSECTTVKVSPRSMSPRSSVRVTLSPTSPISVSMNTGRLLSLTDQGQVPNSVVSYALAPNRLAMPAALLSIQTRWPEASRTSTADIIRPCRQSTWPVVHPGPNSGFT